jgi:hypothetical protein
MIGFNIEEDEDGELGDPKSTRFEEGEDPVSPWNL